MLAGPPAFESTDHPVRADLVKQMWTAVVDRATASLTTEFEAQSIPYLVLKGPAFAQFFYDDPTDRPYTDTDLIVPIGERDRAEQVLAECSFVRVDRDEDWIGPAPKYAHTFQCLHDGAVVDLHWRLSGAAAPPARVWSLLYEHATEIEVAGRSVRTLDLIMSAVLIALHNAHHGTGWPRTLVDLDQAIRKLDVQDWHLASALAAQLDAAEAFAAGMRLTHAGNALADVLELGRPASVEMWLKTNPSSYGAWVLDRLSQDMPLKARARLCLQVLLPPPTVMSRFFPVAQRGRLGLALAYLARPFRLLKNAAPAVREWRRARDAARRQVGAYRGSALR